MDKIRIGFVGVGGMGQCAHLRNYVTLPDCEVVAIAEIREQLGKLVAQRYGVPRVYGSHEELLASEKLDGIVASGKTTAPNGTAVRVTTQAGAMLDFSFVVGTGANTPSAVDIRKASTFSINTGRALIVDYDYLFDAQAGLVGFQRR